MQNSYGKLFLIPNFLSEENDENFLPNIVSQKINHIKNYIVESEKEARRLLKNLKISTPQNELEIHLWNEHSNKKEAPLFLELFKNGIDVGLISDAGLPCIADPGNEIVLLAHQKNIDVIPLPGASSIFMALMASGMNGQNFVFHGYLPIDKKLQIKKIKEMEFDSASKNNSQIFMEAPYRNNKLFSELMNTCNSQTKICIAANISSGKQFIKTQTVENWKNKIPELHKIPVIFIIG